jgi:hypothetical protein
MIQRFEKFHSLNENKLSRKEKFQRALTKFLITLKEEGDDYERVLNIIGEFYLFRKTSKDNLKFIRTKFLDFLKYSGIAIIWFSPIPATTIMLAGLAKLCIKYNIPLLPSRFTPKKELELNENKEI